MFSLFSSNGTNQTNGSSPKIGRTFTNGGNPALGVHYFLMMVFAGGIAFWVFLALTTAEQPGNEGIITQFRMGLPFAAGILVAYGVLIIHSVRASELHGFYRSLSNRIAALSDNGYIFWDAKRQKVHLSNSMLRLLGLHQKGQSIARSVFNALTHPDDVQHLNVLNAWAADSENPHEFSCELRLKHANGSWRWIQISASKIPLDDKSRLGSVIAVCSDIARQAEMVRDPLNMESRVFEALDSISDAFALQDQQGQLVTCNKQFLALHSISPNSAIPGVNVSELMSDAANDPTSSTLQVRNLSGAAETVGGAPNAPAKQVVQISDGRWLAITENTTAAGDRTLLESDVTQIMEQVILAEQRLSSLRQSLSDMHESNDRNLMAKEAAERANKSQSEELVRISHEIRTQFNGVLGFGQMLHKLPFGPLGKNKSAHSKYLAYVESILVSAQALLISVDSLLEGPQLETNRTDVNIRPVEVDKLIRSCLRVTQKGQESAQVRLSDALNVNQAIACDEHALRQVILYLMNHAISHGNAGSEFVIASGLTGGSAFIEVSDNSINIAESVFQSLDHPQALPSNNSAAYSADHVRDFASCQRVISLHQGTLDVNHTKRKGTTVRITLPVSRGIAQASNDQSIATPAAEKIGPTAAA